MATTYTVNLETVNFYTHFHPHSRADGANFRDTRSTWFPDLLRNNRSLKHGDTFIVDNATLEKYLNDNFISGEFKFLDKS